MQEECEVYVDPEEDEVFFGCISDRERNIYAKVSERGGSIQGESELKKHLNNPSDDEIVEDGNENLTIIDIKLTDKTYQEEVNNESENVDPSILRNDINASPRKDEESGIICLNNASIELDHNYSTPMKQKIDKSILSTPKSIVKADKDGGFLKVLSEIALVKAEADKKSESIEKNDEDKENKMIYSIPDIVITEASPEKMSIKSPHSKSQKARSKRFKIVYNSPKSPDKVSPKKGVGSKALAENFESSQNLKNISLDKDANISGPKELESSVNEDIRSSQELLNKSIDLIEFNDSNFNEVTGRVQQVSDDKFCEEISEPQIESPLRSDRSFSGYDKSQSEVVSPKCDLSDEVNNEQKRDEEVEDNLDEIEIIVELSTDATDFKKGDSKEDATDTIVLKGTLTDEKINEGFNMNFVPDVEPIKDEGAECLKSTETILKDLRSEEPKEAERKPIPGYRFSKEARKIVEGLKKAAVDDTLNFTIQEIDVENTENSFVSPEPISMLDETIIASKNVQSVIELKKTPKILTKTNLSRPKTVQATRRPFSPVLSQSRIPSARYLSDRKIQVPGIMEGKNCVKKLPLEEKKTPRVEDKWKGGGDGKAIEKDSNSVPLSRIPVFGLKACKPGVPVKTTPLKNPKFKNIESPINAYIHNKTTALVVNVKPEPKKDRLGELWKKNALKSGNKMEDKVTIEQSPKKLTGTTTAAALPFVQYKSAIPYKVEKRPESRLPRLAPSVQKLIGNHSPKVLKHEGRFYVKTPRQQQVSHEDNTIVADAGEVSVVLSQVAQKSNTIK